MEIQQLQLTIEREIQARQQLEKQLKQLKSDIIDKTELALFLNTFFPSTFLFE